MTTAISSTTIVLSGDTVIPICENAELLCPNSFEMRVGGLPSFGRFLITRDNWNTIAANGKVAASLKMTGSLSDGTETSITIPVQIGGVVPLSKALLNAPSDILQIVLYDNRYLNLTNILATDSSAWNCYSPANTGQTVATNRFYASTINGTATYTWTDIFTAVGLHYLPGTIPTWTPENVLFDNLNVARAADVLARRLCYMIGWYDNLYLLYAPGTSNPDNQKLFAQLATATSTAYKVTGGSSLNRLPLRAPGTLHLRCAVYDSDNTSDPYKNVWYEKTYTVTGGDPRQDVTVTIPEMFVAYTSGAFANTTNADAAMADISARIIANLTAPMFEYEFAGLWPFSPDGYFRSVRWINDHQGPRTVVRINQDQNNDCLGPDMQYPEQQRAASVFGLGMTAHTGAGGTVLAGPPPVSNPLVKLMQDNGSGHEGDATTACDFTYSLLNAVDGTPIKDHTGTAITGQVPQWPPRDASAIIGKRAPATFGWTYTDNSGTLQLAVALEADARGPIKAV